MRWSPRVLVVLVVATILTGGGIGDLPAELPTGVTADFQSPDDSGFSRIAVAGADQILIGSDRGTIWNWNPATGKVKKLPTASSDPAPIANLRPIQNDRLILRRGPFLEIGTIGGDWRRVSLPSLAQVEISPTGRALAGMTEAPPLRFFSTQTGKQTHRADRQVRLDEMRYSPTGRFLAAYRFGRLFLWDSETGELVWKVRLEGNLQGCVFSPDEVEIFAAAARDGIWVIDVASGRVERRFSRRKSFAEDKSRHHLAVSPDGSLLAESQLGRRIVIWEAPTGRPVLSLEKHPGKIIGLEFLPDGFRLLSADAEGRAYLWDLSDPSFAAPFDVGKPYQKEDLNTIWRKLGAPQGPRAWSAMIALKHRPEQTLALIDDPPNAEEQIRRLIRRLDDDDFTVRQAAHRGLKQLSLRAEPLLKTAIKRSTSAEATARIRRLLADLSGPRRETQLKRLRESRNHRQLRLIQVLRWIGTPQARERLKCWAETSNDSAIRRQVEAAAAWIDRQNQKSSATQTSIKSNNR